MVFSANKKAVTPLHCICIPPAFTQSGIEPYRYKTCFNKDVKLINPVICRMVRITESKITARMKPAPFFTAR